MGKTTVTVGIVNLPGCVRAAHDLLSTLYGVSNFRVDFNRYDCACSECILLPVHLRHAHADEQQRLAVDQQRHLILLQSQPYSCFVMSSYVLTKLEPQISLLIWSFHNINNILKNVLIGFGIASYTRSAAEVNTL